MRDLPYDIARDIMIGLAIFKAHGQVSVSAEHDIIYAGPNGLEVELTELEKELLDKAGWHYEDEVDSWARFV